jgi:hypothetical protein
LEPTDPSCLRLEPEDPTIVAAIEAALPR